jgi:predicted DNA-binding WGR domain protein
LIKTLKDVCGKLGVAVPVTQKFQIGDLVRHDPTGEQSHITYVHCDGKYYKREGSPNLIHESFLEKVKEPVAEKARVANYDYPRICHFYNVVTNADRIYVVFVRKQDINRWEVIAQWGYRKGHLNETVKSSFSYQHEAIQERDRLFNEKLGKGYQDITAPSYSGPARAEDVMLMATHVNPHSKG